MLTLLYFILMLGIIIFIHELGHMLVAKMFGIYVYEFSIGFGPTIWSHQGKETKYSIRLIPLGGFTGMVESEETVVDYDKTTSTPTEILNVPVERTFYGAHPFKRILTLIAGPFFNMLLAMVVFISIFQITGYVTEYPEPRIEAVAENSPAAKAGIEAGDLITKMVYKDGTVIIPETFYDVIVANTSNVDTITIYVVRNGEELSFNVTPVYSEEYQQYMIGISSPPLIQNEISFWEAIPIGIEYCFYVISQTFMAIINLFKGQGLENLGGTIAIYEYTKEAASYGFTTLLSLMGSLSVSVGLMNLIPITIFDGGKIVITLIEWITHKRMSSKTENLVNMIGIAIVFLLFVFVTIQDLGRAFH